MAKVPAKAFAGRWRIVEMDNWDNDFIDLVEKAHITFHSAADGEIVFGALKGFLDVRYVPAMARLAPSSPGKAPTRTIPLPAAGGSLSASTMVRNQASSVNETDFFNSLLEIRHGGTVSRASSARALLPVAFAHEQPATATAYLQTAPPAPCRPPASSAPLPIHLPEKFVPTQ